MILRYFVILSALLIALPGYSQSSSREYNYRIDLTTVVDDRIFVELTTPKISSAQTIFYFPKIVPGTYAIEDYGRYVSEFKAFDKKGKELPVEKEGVNGYKISKAQKLVKISYWVDDTFDTPKEGPEIFQPAGTNIEAGKNFILNTSGFFGYFENAKDAPVNFDVIRPADFYGSTGLIAKETGAPLTRIQKEGNSDPTGKKLVDRFTAENYDRLVDSPLMYSKPDTAIVRVANTEVLISSYSPNEKISAKEIANTVREVLMAQKEFLGGQLPVEKYAFIFYFSTSPSKMYGALEHSYSSMYFLPEATIRPLHQYLRDFAAHEFFHIVTPLTIHSEEIQRFEFNDPKMSKHLWLYEGVTEYFAGNVQVKYGLIPVEKYLNVLHNKMVGADSFNDSIAFTDLSKFTLEKYKDQYGNVYEKGALIGLCLDLKLIQLSGGKYTLRDLVKDLSKKYGKNMAFKDDELFTEIQALTYPELNEFFSRYVAGNEPLPYKELLETVGVKYLPSQDESRLSIGFSADALGVDSLNGRQFVTVKNAGKLTQQGRSVGLYQGDKILKINGEELPAGQWQAVLFKHFQELKEGQTLSFTVLREDENGAEKMLELKAPVVPVIRNEKHALHLEPNPTAEQLALRKAWLEPR